MWSSTMPRSGSSKCGTTRGPTACGPGATPSRGMDTAGRSPPSASIRSVAPGRTTSWERGATSSSSTCSRTLTTRTRRGVTKRWVRARENPRKRAAPRSHSHPTGFTGPRTRTTRWCARGATSRTVPRSSAGMGASASTSTIPGPATRSPPRSTARDSRRRTTG